MPEPIFIIFELSVYILLAICLRHALARRRAIELLAGVTYGLLLEIATIIQLQGYHYGRFLIMFGQVPLCIGVGWGVILYSAMTTTDNWNVLPVQRPFADALLAWSIDLSMDAIAIRLGFWTWAFNGLWFGVPLANFFAWYVVVASFSAFIRVLRVWQNRPILRWVYPFAAMALSLALLLTLDSLYVTYAYHPYNMQLIIIGGQFALSLISLWTSRRELRLPKEIDWTIASVPIIFHLFYTGALLWGGFYQQVPMLLIVALTLLLLGVALHTLPLIVARFCPRSDVNAYQS